MKKSLSIVLCIAIVLTTFAVGLSAFAGTDSLSVVKTPEKLYYIDAKDEVDVTGAELKVKIDGEAQVLKLTQNITRTGSLADASAETPAAAASTKASVAKVKVYYDYPLAKGENQVIFKYDDKTASCKVYFDENPVKSVAVTKAPDKKNYFSGDDFKEEVDLKGLEITVTFNKCGGSKEQSFVYKYNDKKNLTGTEKFMFMGYRFSIYAANEGKTGSIPFIVTYLGKEARFNINYQEVIYGDVNDDGVVNAADLVRLSRIVIGGEKLAYSELKTDIVDDDKINSKDLKALRQMLTRAENIGGFEWVLDAQLLSYKVDEYGTFYTDGDPWQRNFGFNALYDYAAPYACMYYDTFRVYFDYGTYEDGTPKQWMIQPWKGQYGMVLFGAEVGVYTKRADRVTLHYDCADDNDLVGMEMTVYKDKKLAFTRPYDQYWWVTGFKPGALDNYTDLSKPHDQLIVKVLMDFPSNEMAEKFAEGLEQKGFDKVGFLDTTTFRKVDTYTISNNRVIFLWRDVVDSDVGTNM